MYCTFPRSQGSNQNWFVVVVVDTPLGSNTASFENFGQTVTGTKL
jgi:hypothetical protein